jgi:hypothetical protein
MSRFFQINSDVERLPMNNSRISKTPRGHDMFDSDMNQNSVERELANNTRQEFDILTVGGFSGDGDVVWQHDNGTVAVWLMKWDGNRVRGICWRRRFGVEDPTSELKHTHLECVSISPASGTMNLTSLPQ